MTRYSPWAELARTDLVLEWADDLPAGRLGEYDHDWRVVRLRNGMTRRQARSVLCHELRHAEAGDEFSTCDRANLRQEQRADRDAARLLIEVEALRAAALLHGHHHSAVAVELRVSDNLLKVRLDTLHPAERAYLSGYSRAG